VAWGLLQLGQPARDHCGPGGDDIAGGGFSRCHLCERKRKRGLKPESERDWR
jgi:hypothetical protein